MSFRNLMAFDEPYVTDIDIKSYSKPWTFGQLTEESTTVVLVEGKVVGFYVLRYGTRLLRFAVHPSWRKCGVGTLMMDELKKGTSKVTVVVPESADGVHLFLKANGFACVNVMGAVFRELDTWEAGYFFLWKR